MLFAWVELVCGDRSIEYLDKEGCASGVSDILCMLYGIASLVENREVVQESLPD